MGIGAPGGLSSRAAALRPRVQRGRPWLRSHTRAAADLAGRALQRRARVPVRGCWAAGRGADVPWDFAAGPGSPLARLVGTGGQVLCLGAPLDALTVLHYAETLVERPQRRLVAYEVPVRAGEGIEWRSVRDIDTSSRGAFPYEEVVAGEDVLAVIGREALAAGAGRSGAVGSSTSHLFDARALVDFATSWLGEHFS